MDKTVVNSHNAPEAIGAYSQAVINEKVMCVSGQLPISPNTNLMPDSIEDQVKQSMENIMAIIDEAGGTEENILRCGIFTTDLSLFDQINQIYSTFFDNDPPARFVVEVARLPKDAKIEIEAIAVIN